MEVHDHRSKVRWGIIGPGNIARYAIAPAIRYSSNGTLHAVASRSAARGAALALEAGAATSFGSYEKLLETREIDAVYIGLPNGLHEEWVLRAAEAGKHILCEKSLTFTAESAARMKQACAARGVVLMEAFMYRHHPQWYHVRDAIYQGRIGEIVSISASLGGTLANRDDHRWSAELGRGALYDVTCYGINVARYLTGREPLRVQAAGTMLTPLVDKSTSVLLEFDGGIIASVHGSLVSDSMQGLQVIGTEGTLTVPHPFIPNNDPTTIRIVRREKVEELVVGGANQFLHQVEHFASCALTGGGLRYPAEDGLANVTACELAARSLAATTR